MFLFLFFAFDFHYWILSSMVVDETSSALSMCMLLDTAIGMWMCVCACGVCKSGSLQVKSAQIGCTTIMHTYVSIYYYYIYVYMYMNMCSIVPLVLVDKCVWFFKIQSLYYRFNWKMRQVHLTYFRSSYACMYVCMSCIVNVMKTHFIFVIFTIYLVYLFV